MRSQIVLGLKDVNFNLLDLVGGKAASLGEMLSAGLPVPYGFVVTTNAYDQNDTSELEKEVLEAFDRLGASRVAVRSSAVAEDSLEASWAGQLETVLNVTRDELMNAVNLCRDSIQSERAQSYAADHKIGKKNQKVAVVVQAMIDSHISGVIFSVNPISGNPKELIVEAIYGLGELLVQGSVTPESVVWDKIKDKEIDRSGHQQISKLVYEDGKNVLVPVKGTGTILSTEQLSKLASIAKQIETYYKTPQDIEWGIKDDKIYILQSRPITAGILR